MKEKKSTFFTKIKPKLSAFNAKVKPKYYINYVLILVPLILFSIIYFTGGMKLATNDLLTQVGYSIILAVSLNLVVGLLGELSLGHAGFMCVGAFIGTVVVQAMATAIPSHLIRLVIGMLVGGIAAAIFGFLVGLPALRLKGDYLAIVTLAFGEIIRTVIRNLPWFGKALGLVHDQTYGGKLFIVAFMVAILMLFLVQNLIRSKHGRAITAIRDNEIAAKTMGINVTFYKLLVFVVAAFFAGVAGVLYGAFVSPIETGTFSYNYSIEILVMVVLGGMGSITGSIVAATAVTFINFELTKILPADLAGLKYLIYALILIIMVIYNNAPALKSFRERFGPAAHIKKLRDRIVKHSPATVYDDSAAWDRVPTKIRTDEVLSADFALTTYEPDKPDKRKNNSTEGDA